MEIEYAGTKITLTKLPNGKYMKPNIAQFTTAGRGCTWLDDARIPAEIQRTANTDKSDSVGYGANSWQKSGTTPEAGRFPANLLCSDDVLNDGTITKSTGVINRFKSGAKPFGGAMGEKYESIHGVPDSGSYSRYFSLDAWAQNLPFLQVPKASKREKNEGLDCIVSIAIMDEWDKEAKPVQLQVVMDNSRLKATVVSGTQNKNVIVWSMSLFGSDFMDVPFLLNTKSTTLTETSSITPQIISSYLTGLLTSGRIANAYLKTESGGNLVQPAENSNTSESTTNEETESATSASPVSSKERYAISVKDGSNIHSTVKPLKLISYLITLGSRPGDVVLDPFIGSGTTAIAAKQLGRKYIGIEREAEYVEIAQARLNAVPDTLL